jgi:methyl-accepting chemotaxis protein
LVATLGAAFLLIAPIAILLIGIFSQIHKTANKNTKAIENFKAALAAIKEAFFALSKPLFDLILKFSGVSKGTDAFYSRGEKVAAIIYAISKVVRQAAEGFKNFATTIGQAFMSNTVAPIITRMINRFILIGRAIKAVFSGGDLSERFKNITNNLKALFWSLMYDFFAAIEAFFEILSKAMVHAVPLIAKFVQVIFDLFKQLTRKIIEMMAYAINPVNWVKGAVNLTKTIFSLFGDDGGDGPGRTATTLAEKLAAGLSGAAMGVSNIFEDFKKKAGAKYFDATGKDIGDALVGGTKDKSQEFQDAIRTIATKAAQAA